ncbi:MAG: AAA family ATPase [Desulfohalobiaceae bacterium]|nr:AAA family ATPase [Desulfohalobiaceae bacterium]
MYLEDVIIEGFKSFSQETHMQFQPGINVFIGNNGVGKSNILDAVVWALGENSPHRLRCYQPGDLFFAGDGSQSPARRIKVHLTFREGRDKNAAALNVSREMTQDGFNRYAIGEDALSESDFRRRLSAFQLDKSLETIIRQEQINDLLQLNPRGRFDAICFLMNLDPAEDLPPDLKEKIARRLNQYLAYLMPRTGIELESTAQNGFNEMDLRLSMPGGRQLRSHQLSGGQKAVTSLALKLALFEQLQPPFYLLDEVEPSLDYTHHKSMQAFLKDISDRTQLIMITHLRATIDLADSVHGVRTRPDGSSFMKFYFLMDEKLLRLYKCC